MYKSNYEGTISVTLGGTVSVNTLAVVGGFVGMYLKGGGSGDIVPFLVQGKIAAATKVGSQAWAVGDALYYDSGNSRFTKTPQGSSPDAIAASIVGSGAGETTGDVILLANGGGGADDFGATGIKTDLIAESTSGSGITIDGVKCKDNDVLADSIEAKTGATGLNIFESGGKGGFFGTAPATQPAHVADPAAMAAITAATLTDNGGGQAADGTIADIASADATETCDRSVIADAVKELSDQINKLVVDVTAAKTAIDANNAAIDSINAFCATLGLTASS